MASASSSLAGLPLDQLSLYHAVDPILSSVFVLHGPVTTANSVLSSSRIQAHIISPSGVQSYPRITVSPAAPLYAAVNHLPREKQGDELYRGLAVCLYKYFFEIPDPVKETLVSIARAGKQNSKPALYFDETHAAELADRMLKVDNPMAVVRDLKDAFGDRVVPCIDIDLVLPTGSINPPSPTISTRDSIVSSPIRDKFSDRFGKYAPLIEALGEPLFLPTSKLRRAPSQPTNISKSKLFSASQKEALRLSMCEVVDTEERYVQKMYDLVHNVANDFCQKARNRPPSSISPDESKLSQLFPPCLNDILEVNMGFLDAIRSVLEQTETGALDDIAVDTTLESSVFPRDPSTGKRKDPIGAIAFGQCMLDWFPRFSKPYGEYMHAHTGFYTLLNSFLGDQNSSFSKRVYETGEQRMRSLLMEPIQRLPRYSLLIDTMTSALPSMHPAVRSLLKARDTITEICSLDSSTDHSESVNRLQKLAQGWPTSVAPTGRLITAADVWTLQAPFRSGSSGSRGDPGILLVFTDVLVLLTKRLDSKWVARGLCADLERPRSSADNDPTDLAAAPDLKFGQVFSTNDVRCTQSKCGRVMYLVPSDNFVRNQRSRTKPTHLALELVSAYETKATKLIEEITKARIEGRFSEQYRGGGKWSLHSPKGTSGEVGVLLSIFEQESNAPEIQPSSSNIRLLVDRDQDETSLTTDNTGTEVLVSITSLPEGSKYKMELQSVVGSPHSDTFSGRDFVATLSKRLTMLLRPLSQPQNPSLTEILLHTNFSILRIVAEHILGHGKIPRVFRPPSPTKFLSTLWGNGQIKGPTHSPSKSLPSVPVVTNIPTLRPQSSTSSKLSITSKSQEGGINVAEEAADQFQQLEKSFTAYILAIRSRSGNIVGRTLRARDRVDPAAVNELYNVLLENPGKLQAAAEAPVDVLIVAFENFIEKAWKEKIGPIIPQDSLSALQLKFDTMFPGDFESFFRGFLSNMGPQTSRAFTALIKLLAELLNASGNDGDRGALTDVFSEILTENGDARKTIPLLDRLVEDFDRLFDESAPVEAPMEGILVHDLALGRSRAQSVNTGSISSNASSFRRRFGFGLNRENSIKDNEGKVSAIIRSLSKSKGNGEADSQYLSLPRSSLLRSKSIDTDSRLQSFLRPRSRDRPLLPSLLSVEDESHRPTSSHSNAPSLASIGEAPTTKKSSPPPKKKRRSSLSDLKLLPPTEVPPLFANRELRKPATPTTPRIPVFVSGPSTPPNKPNFQSPSVQSFSRVESPAGYSSPLHQMPTNKENVAPSPRTPLGEQPAKRRSNVSTLGSPQLTRKRADSHRAVSPPKSTTGRAKSASVSCAAGNRNPRYQVTSPSSPQKLRMQNPQKLRERVNNEKKAMAAAESSLRMELTSITDEISSKIPTAPGRPVSTYSRPVSSPSTSGANNTLTHRVRALESKLSAMSSSFGARATSLESDIETSLLVSEKRVRKLDELYREASAENEALYDRFNSELSKMAKDIRAGSGEEALKKQLKDALDEVTRVKKENLRLKREISGLKAQQVGESSK